MIKIKDNVNLEILREFGFKKGKEWADLEERCLCGDGYKYKHDRWFKFRMDEEDNSKIAYIDDDYDIPYISISVFPESRELYLDVSIEETYHICGRDLNVVTETIMELTLAGLLEKYDE